MKINEIINEAYDGKKVDADNLKHKLIQRNHAWNLHRRAVAHVKTLDKDDLTNREKDLLSRADALNDHYSKEISDLKAKVVSWNKTNPDYKVSVSLAKEAKPINKERYGKDRQRYKFDDEMGRRLAKRRAEEK